MSHAREIETHGVECQDGNASKSGRRRDGCSGPGPKIMPSHALTPFHPWLVFVRAAFAEHHPYALCRGRDH